MQLNEQQQRAVDSDSPYILNLSPAGTGKTTVLTQRVVRLLRDKVIAPSNLLLLTFTNKAAAEMQDRLINLLDESSVRLMTIGTFHAVGLQILRQWGRLLGYDTDHLIIYDEMDTMDILDISIHELDLPVKARTYLSLRSQMIPPDEMEPDYRILHKHYLQLLKQENAVDFQSILDESYRLLSEHKECRQYYHNRFQFVFIDEFQDTDNLQYDIIKLIDPRSIFTVADFEQSIYGWRGSNPELLYDFDSLYGAETIKQTINYRSTHEIVEVANNLIQNHMNPYTVLMEATKGGKSVEVNFFETIEEEVQSITTHLRRTL